MLTLLTRLTRLTPGRRQDRKEAEDWGGAAGRPAHTSVILHPPSATEAAPRQLLRRRTQAELATAAPGDGMAHAVCCPVC